MSAIREVYLHSLKHGVYNSICRTCFRKVSTQPSEISLAADEEQHVCQREDASTRRKYMLLLEALNRMN
jgi:hypothetical protein